MKYGLQLYSVRDAAKDALQDTLQKVARLGYQDVEFAGFFGHKAEDVKGWLAEYRLNAPSTHTGLQALDEDFDGVVAYHKTIGCATLVIPYTKPATQAELSALIDKLNGYQKRLAAQGITMAYHNHAHEFQAVEGGPSLWDALVEKTSIPLEIDTFWVYAAGEDPVAWMKTLHARRRLPVIHIKDGLANGEGKPLGLGTAPVKAVYQTALALSVPMIVESETLTPTGLDEARVCIEYLRSLA